MGKKLTLLLSLLLAVVVMAGPAYALSMPFKGHHETGRITAIDKDARMVTVAGDKDGKSYSFQVKDRASLDTLRTGEHVRVSYKKEGARLVATDIKERAERHTASKR
jgi:Cu/Ag efflux protein CusF